jgi:hypothetical protein
LDQLYTSSGGEFGVQTKYLDGERHFVGDTLAGPVPARKEFEVFEPVVTTVAVDVMDGFVGVQPAPQVLFHDEAVFKHGFFAPASAAGRHGDAPIAVAGFVPGQSFNAARGKCGRKSGRGGRSLVLRLAFLVAVFLLRVHSTARLTPVAALFAASEAGESRARFGVGTATFRGTGNRAVQRVVAEFLLVRRQVSLLHDKIVSAVLAGEIHRNAACGRGIFAEPVSASAQKAAKSAPCRDLARVAVKRFVTMVARTFDGHEFVSGLVAKTDLMLGSRSSQAAVA